MKKLMITAAVLAAANVYAGWGDFGKAAAKEATAATIRGVAGALSADKKSDGASSKKDRAKQERVDAEKAERDKKMKHAKKGQEKSASAPVTSSDISTIKDDAQFFAAFKNEIKDAGDKKESSFFERACNMKDENLLIEFLALYPDYTARVADIHSDKFEPSFAVKSSKLAELMLDSNCKSEYGYTARIINVLFYAAKVIDEPTRKKYIKIADDNLAAAKNDEDLLVVDRYYVGMPVIDYVMRAFEEKRAWTKDYDSFTDYLRPWTEDDSEVCDNWKKDWKMKTLHFTSKERAKTFKIKGTMEGFVEFLKKYVDKTATVKDITVENGWWIYLDDPHELKMELNDNNGVLNIYRQR